MISGIIRPVLVSAFAIFFGVGQLFCACLSANAMSMSQVAAEIESPHEMPFGMAHSIMGDAKTENSHGKDHQQGAHDHDGEHEHMQDCQHCDGLDIFTGTSDVGGKMTIPLPSIEKVILPKVVQRPLTRAGMAPNALAGLRWLHPPNETPVTLKIRLLN